MIQTILIYMNYKKNSKFINKFSSKHFKKIIIENNKIANTFKYILKKIIFYQN